MSTLQQLTERTYDMLRETASDGHFTPAQIRGYLNHGQEYMAALNSPPEDLFEVATEENIGLYQMPSDNLVVGSVYFGNSLASSDILPLKLVNKTLMKELFPGWLDETSGNAGQPKYALKFDKKTLYIHPRPDKANAGKRIYMFYGYIPTSMVNDSDEPDIANNYHNLLPFFACRLAYYALSNPEMAKETYSAFINDYKAIFGNVDAETEETFKFKWVK